MISLRPHDGSYDFQIYEWIQNSEASHLFSLLHMQADLVASQQLVLGLWIRLEGRMNPGVGFLSILSAIF
jgi:hypothetical protein